MGNLPQHPLAVQSVSHYESELKVNAAPDAIFAYVKDPENMPQYLPTVTGAHSQGAGRVEVEGEAAGHDYKSDGWFKVDDQSRSMSWGSDGEHKYSGRLDVRPHEDHSHVSVSLDFEPHPGEEKAFQEQSGSRDRTIQDGLDAALQAIKVKMESGKE